MDVPSRAQHLILPVAPLAAAAVGLLTAALFALLPTAGLESLVVDSGIASVLSAAEPPLGFTARAVLVLLCGGGVGSVAWFALFLVLGTRSVVLQRPRGGGDTAPVLRRADAHPDAPARQPVFANRDLGTPFLDVRARPRHIVAETIVIEMPEERSIPDDLDQPLAAFDPGSVPETPADWSIPTQFRPVAPPAPPVLAPGERLETFALNPAVRTASPPPEPVGDDPSVTIHALLDRLERSVTRREPEREDTLQDSLATLRRMATRSA